VEEIIRYFPGLDAGQKKKLEALGALYSEWNSVINLISRKDFSNFYTNHVLHSLSIAMAVPFRPGEKILDIGTGGGFPGIPLAILFPDTSFTLIDSIKKKIKVVKDVAARTGLSNVRTVNCRAEQHNDRYNFVVSRAVAPLPTLVSWSKGKITGIEGRKGIIALKGGDLTGETGEFAGRITVWDIKDLFSEPWFETKKIIWLRF
jgi:16S rRNA (guanine527-N7)-methyltransferase